MINYIPLIVALVSFGGGLITWYLNEKSKRRYERYKRKEEHYAELILSIDGFYAGFESQELKSTFIHQVNLCWLYCPDDVITKLYAFLRSVENGTDDDRLKVKLLGEVMEAIRNDLFKDSKMKSSITSDTFKPYRAN